jgi:SAM-dependent methyltransferase
MTSIYLTSPDGRLKWWTMDLEVTETNLINRANSDRLYGVQNAPTTESGIETPYDSFAAAYDQLHPASDKMTRALRGAVASLSGDFSPAVLDVGCGTGRVLDLGVTMPDRYAGVDPSQPMLNQLVRKHPNVGALYPIRIEQALAARLFTHDQFEIVTALLSDADKLDDDTTARLAEIASRGLIVARGDEMTVVDTRSSVGQARH